MVFSRTTHPSIPIYIASNTLRGDWSPVDRANLSTITGTRNNRDASVADIVEWHTRMEDTWRSCRDGLRVAPNSNIDCCYSIVRHKSCEKDRINSAFLRRDRNLALRRRVACRASCGTRRAWIQSVPEGNMAFIGSACVFVFRDVVR